MKPKIGNVVNLNGKLAVVYSDYGTALNIVYFDGSADVILRPIENVEIMAPNLQEYMANNVADLLVTQVLLEEQLFKAITGGYIDVDKCNELLEEYCKREGIC